MHDRDACDLSGHHPVATGALSLLFFSLSPFSLSLSLSPPPSFSWLARPAHRVRAGPWGTQGVHRTMGHRGRVQGQSTHVGPRHVRPNSLSLSPPFSLFLSIPFSVSPHMLCPSLSPHMLSLFLSLYRALSLSLSPLLSLSIVEERETGAWSLSPSLTIAKEREMRDWCSVSLSSCPLSLIAWSLSHLALSLTLLQRRERLRRLVSLPLWTTSEEGGGVIPADGDSNDNDGGDASGNGDSGDGG